MRSISATWFTRDWDKQTWFDGRNKPDPLRRKFQCAALCPHQITKETFERMPGFRALMNAAQAEDLNVAFNLSVCHFKPGPNAEGRWPVSNPEAVVIVRVDGDKEFKDAKLTVYEDKFAHTSEYTVGLQDLARYNVFKPLQFKNRTDFLSAM